VNRLKYIIIYGFFQAALWACTAFSQPTTIGTTHSDSLDSLLLAGDVKHYLSLLEESRSPSEMDEHVLLSNRLRELSNGSVQRMEAMCRELDSSASKFEATHAGVNAHIVFDKFLEAKSAEKWKDALACYYVARHFRSQYIANDKLRLQRNFSAAEDLYVRGQFSEALQAVKKFRLEDPTSPALIVLRDSLTDLYDKLETKSSAGLSAVKRELEAGVVDKWLTISFSGGLSTFARQEERPTAIRFEDIEFTPEPFPSTIKPFYSIQADYFVSPVISISLQVKGGPIYNADVFAEPFGTPNPARIHIVEEYISIASGPTFFFREKTGLRPFVRLIAGVLTAHRSATLKSAKWERWGLSAGLSDMRKSYPLLAFEMGSEYEPSTTGFFYLGVHVSVSNHFGDTTLIRHFVGSGEFRIGINIL
jgi:hypothetical protein